MSDFVADLKKDTQRVHRFQNENDSYGIGVLGRGENLFFQKNDKAFICEIDAVHSSLYAKSIKTWDNGEKIKAEERKDILEMLVFLYRKFYNDSAKLI